MTNLSPDQERRFEQLKIHLASIRGLLGDKAGIATVVSSIAAAILIIATFNPNLLPITTGLKIAITVLLALIPISLLIYILEMFHAIATTTKAIEDLVGKISSKDPWLLKFYNRTIGYSSFFTSLILAGVIIYIVFVIWW